MSSIAYLAQANYLTTRRTYNQSSNPERTYMAMKYIGKKINQVTRAEYVVDLFRDLKKENIPLRTVSNMCNKMCNDVKPEQTKKTHSNHYAI